MKKVFEKIIAFVKENKKMTAILIVFLIVGGIVSSFLSGLCYEHWAKTGRLPFWKPDKICVVIDPGHGGNDVGAVNGGRYEKDDNLRLALKVKECLEEKGIDVILTRSDDTFISLENRCKIANSHSADLYVSLHRNSAKPDAQGVEIWIGSENSYRARSLAKYMLDGLSEAGISQNRGVRVGYISGENKDYYVNKNTDMPSCLVELGFITNNKDNELYDKNIDVYAQVIANAIEEHL